MTKYNIRAIFKSQNNGSIQALMERAEKARKAKQLYKIMHGEGYKGLYLIDK